MVDLVSEIQQLPTERLHPDPRNPNEQKDEVFNGLVAAIEEEGFIEPVHVVPREDGDWDIVGGEHRWRAMTVMQEPLTPCIVLDAEKFDEDRRAWNLVKLNVLRGDLNPVKFSHLFDELKQRYGDEVTKQLMGFTTEDGFRRLYREVARALPPELQQALEDTKDEIRTIDDLSLVLNRLFAEYGETLPSDFMVFSFGGREVLWVRADADLWRLVTALAKDVEAAGESMSEVMKGAIQDLSAVRADVGSV